MLLDLSGKKILVTGIANNRSIAWGIAQQLKAAGAELGITYLPEVCDSTFYMFNKWTMSTYNH